MRDLKISDIERIFSKRTPGIMNSLADYSVLVPLVEINGEVSLLFEVRASGLERQPGEVCFPGGKMEKGETPQSCAVRETAEELGINCGDIKVIAQLDIMHTHTNLTIYSFLGEIDYGRLADMKINDGEVESVFYVPLSRFIENEPYVYKMEVIPDVRDDFPYDMIDSTGGYNWKKGVSEVPIYKLSEKTIWGFTARICANAAKILRENAVVSG